MGELELLEEQEATSLALKVQLIFLVILVAGVAIIAGLVYRRRKMEKAEQKYIKKHAAQLPNRTTETISIEVSTPDSSQNSETLENATIPENIEPPLPQKPKAYYDMAGTIQKKLKLPGYAPERRPKKTKE